MSVDYRDFKAVKERSAEPTEATSLPERTFWWKSAKVHEALGALVAAMETEQGPRRHHNASMAHLYGEAEAFPQAYSSAISGGFVPVAPYVSQGRVTYNLVRVAIDTLAAKLAKNRPKVSFVTDGADWAARRRAKRADSWVYGVFHSSELYAEMRDLFVDSCAADTGFLKAYRAGMRIHFERVDPDEIRVSRLDGRYRKPRTMLHVRLVAREVLHGLVDAWNPKLSKAERLRLHESIDNAPKPSSSDYPTAIQALGDMVEVREGWHLPNGPNGEDGRHAITIATATLLDEGYTRERFPIVPFRFSKRRWGYYGQGVAERLAGRQRALNIKLRTVTDSLRLMSVPRYFLPTGAQFEVKQLTNEPGVIMRGLQPPQVLTGNVVPPELFASIETDIRQGLEEVGVSMLSATARKPSGLDSAVALREFNDIESERFSLVGQEWEAAHVEVGVHVVELGAEAAEEGENLEVLVESKRRGQQRLERVAWKELALDKAKYRLKAFPTSSLPSTPAARKKAIQEWYEAGWIDDLEARRLMDVPDLDEANSIALAAREDIDATVARFLEEGKDEDLEGVYEPPEPYQDLQYGLKRFQSEYLRARWLGAPEGRLELLRQWMAQAEGMLAQVAQAQQPAQPPPAGPPQAA